jgi:CRISPR system Cascade subunit CasD
MATLILRLEGPLQSWGVDGAHEVRRTHAQPQKIAVLGLIRAAKGLPRGKIWPELEQLHFQTWQLRRPRRMWDFLTAENVISADGSHIHPRVLQQLEYLADAAFLVGLEGELTLLEEVRDALESPIFLIGLGRRSCVPSYPIFYDLRDGKIDLTLSEVAQELTIKDKYSDDRAAFWNASMVV